MLTKMVNEYIIELKDRERDELIKRAEKQGYIDELAYLNDQVKLLLKNYEELK